LQYFLGKRRLGMQLLDLYGKLIETGGRPGSLKVGGDADSRQLDGSGVRTVKTLALFSGPVALDANGQAKIPLALPDFNGQLRLMAVAWDRNRSGGPKPRRWCAIRWWRESTCRASWPRRMRAASP
jgi:uncharacterized protein YfaS (alpha-2-macroglobulin family)